MTYSTWILKEEAELSSLLNFRSCEFHIVHDAFKTGGKATDGEIDKVLKATWKICSEGPVSRELFTKFGKANSFPQRFENIFTRLQNNTLSS